MDSKTLTPIASASQAAAARPATPIAAPMPPSGVRRSLALLLGSVLLVAIFAALLAPLLLALVGGVWAAVMEVRTVAAIWALARHQDYGAIFAHLDTLDTASRVAFLSVSFFALLFALMLLMAGLLGRHWARLFIVPGLVFTAPTLVCYVVGWLWLAPVAARHGASSFAQTSLAAYMLLDAVVLAAALCDMRPTLRRARRVARLGKRTRPSLPAIHLAGRGGLATAQVWREPVAPDTRRASPTLPPTAPTDLMEDMYGERPRAYPSPRFALQTPITRPMAAIRIEDVAPTKLPTDADAARDEFADSAEAETWRIFSGEWAAWGADDAALHQTVTLPALGWPDDEDEDDAANADAADDATAPTIRAIAPDAPPRQAASASGASAHDDACAELATPIEASSAPTSAPEPLAPATPLTSVGMDEAVTALAVAPMLAPTLQTVMEPTLQTVMEPTPALTMEPTPGLDTATEPVAPQQTAPLNEDVAPVAAAPLTDTATFGALIAIAEAPELADAPRTPDAPLAFALAE